MADGKTQKERKEVTTKFKHADEQKPGKVIQELMKKRGISKTTLEKAKVTQGVTYFPDSKQKELAVFFNYSKDGRRINIKYKSTEEKRYKQVSRGEQIPYNYDRAKQEKDYIVITEGEEDCLSFIQSDVGGVISVPTGANKENNKLEWLDNAYDIVEGKQVFLATDNDKPGRKLREDLATRIGKEHCYIVDYPAGCKDANDVLREHGEKAVRRLVKKAEAYPIEGVITLSERKDEVDRVYEQGVDKGKGVGRSKFDKIIRWRHGMLYLILGYPKDGKSNFNRDTMRLLAERHKWKFGVFGAEEQPYHESFFPDIAEQYIGKPFWGEGRMSKKEKDRALDFVSKHFFMIKAQAEYATVESVLEKGKQLSVQKGIDALVIDPFVALTQDYTTFNRQDQYLGHILNRMRGFRQRYGVALIIVHHPKGKETNQDGTRPPLRINDAWGGSMWNNHHDAGLIISRDQDTDITRARITSLRNKHIGKLGYSDFEFDKLTNRYHEIQEQT